MVAEADDALMERFFEEGTLTADELIDGPAAGRDGGRVCSRSFCTSALQNIGMQPLLDAMRRAGAVRRPNGRSPAVDAAGARRADGTNAGVAT